MSSSLRRALGLLLCLTSCEQHRGPARAGLLEPGAGDAGPGALTDAAVANDASSTSTPDAAPAGDAGPDAHADATTTNARADAAPVERPFVVSSSPALGETGVYPASIVNGTGEAVSLRVRVARAMDVSRQDAVLSSVAGGQIPLSGEWDPGGTTITFVVSAPPFTGAPPLADETDYSLDLSALRSAGGAPLAPEIGLRASRLEFRTGTRDPLLNHSCGHVAFGPYADAVASATPSPTTNRVDRPHHLYLLDLPPISGGDSYGGYVRFQAVADGTFHYFLDREVDVARLDDTDASSPLAARLTPAACDGITHQVTFDGLGDQTYLMHIGPSTEPVLHVIVEAEYASR
ncbi:MAG: hypothetical protein FJ104_09280 [Deltaproteobacteria bacterium]|nr:hypothetical protein [Deltaproteobacteria bacterium]